MSNPFFRLSRFVNGKQELTTPISIDHIISINVKNGYRGYDFSGHTTTFPVSNFFRKILGISLKKPRRTASYWYKPKIVIRYVDKEYSTLYFNSNKDCINEYRKLIDFVETHYGSPINVAKLSEVKNEI